MPLKNVCFQARTVNLLEGNPFFSFWFTLWLFDIAMENGPFIDDFPIKTSIYEGFSMAMLNNQLVNLFISQLNGSLFPPSRCSQPWVNTASHHPTVLAFLGTGLGHAR